MLNAEIFQRFPIGSRFVSRDDPARRVRVVDGYHAPPPHLTLGLVHADETLLVHARSGYWPSLCDPPPDLFAMLTEQPRPARQPRRPQPTVALEVLATPPSPVGVPIDDSDRWGTLQARIAQEAEAERVAAAYSLAERRRAQEAERVAAARLRAEEEAALQQADRHRSRPQRLPVEDSHIESQSEHLRQLTGSLQQLLAEAAQLLNKLSNRLAPPEKTATETHAGIDCEERRLLINEDET